MSLILSWYQTARRIGHRIAHWLSPLSLLILRLYLARVFFLSGLTKIDNWDTTVALFTDEYKVPLLSPTLAAVMGTSGELILPILLVAGLFGRFASLGLFVLNAVAYWSYRNELMGTPGELDHLQWAMMLLVLATIGVGTWAIDALLARRHSEGKGDYS